MSFISSNNEMYCNFGKHCKGFSSSTIKGYCSALSRTISLSGGYDFENNHYLSLLIKNDLHNGGYFRLVFSSGSKVVTISSFEPLFLASFF
jgi:hypothetical protein